MIFSPAISEAEIWAVQDGIASDVRSDGRTLVQRRPFTISTTHATNGASMDVDYDGGRVEVRCGGTTVMAAATPSVVELSETAGAAAATKARGPLFISIDAVPAAVDYYAQALQNHGSRYRHAFLSFLAATIRQAFGAEGVAVREQLGVAEAELVADDEETGGRPPRGADDAGHDRGGGGGGGVGFPGEQLYIGGGYAFRVDVDVHVQEANGGNLPSIISLAVHAALKTMRLPCVTLHETSGGISLEVNRNKPFRGSVDWSRLPVLSVILISPTRHYVVDPTPLEELALPQQLHVAMNAAGQMCYMRYQQLPSTRGNRWRLEEDASRRGEGGGGEPFSAGMNMSDLAAVLQDVLYISQAIISECDEALQKGE